MDPRWPAATLYPQNLSRCALLWCAMCAADLYAAAPQSASDAAASAPAPLPAAPSTLPHSPAVPASPVPLPDARDGPPPLPEPASRPRPATLTPRDFASLDLNGDGLLDQAEATVDPILAERFAALDLDDDDRLSREEFARYQPGPATAIGE